MAQQQNIVKGDALQKLGSLGFIIGGVVLIIFSLLLPRATDPSDTQSVLTAWGNKAGLVTVGAFFIAVGNWLLMIGTAGIYRSIAAGGAAWARLGFYGIIVGTAIGTVSAGLLASGASAGADWLAASAADKTAAFSVAAAVYQVGQTAFTLYILVNWLAIVFLGIGMARSAVYPKWLGWVAIILGILNVVVVGIPQFFAGTQTSTGAVLFAVIATLSAIWAVIIGIWVARRAW